MNDQAVRIVSHCVWFFLIALSFTAGCVVGPNFERPVGPAVTSYDAAPVSLPALGGPDPVQRFIDGGAIARQWWELFRSPALNEVLALAIKASPTLASARATLAQAEEVVVATRGAYYPQIDLAATSDYQYNRSLNRNSLVSSSAAASAKNSLVTSMFNIGPLLTYTPDLFGQNRRLVEEDVALTENQNYQLAAAYLTLTADSVTQAVTIASTVAQIEAVNEIIAADEHNLDLVRIAFAAGSVARTDVLSAESQLANDRTLLPPLRQQLSVAQHALAVLVGKTPAEWSPPAFDLEALTLPGELPVAVPSQLVHERPDILSAEAQLHAASAAIGVATAQLYPTLTLSPSWTLQTATIEGRFAGPDIAAEMAGSIAAPIFHGGTLKALQRAAVDAYEGELNVYRQTVLQAFGQVADVLRALQHDTELLGAESTAATASKASLDLSQAAYAAGRGSLVQVLDAQRLYAQALQGYAHAKGQRYLDSVLLFEAMGGDSKAWIESNAGSQP